MEFDYKNVKVNKINKKVFRIYTKKHDDDLIELYSKSIEETSLIESSKHPLIQLKDNRIFIRNNEEFLFNFETLFSKLDNKNYYSIKFNIDNINVYGLGDKMAPIRKNGYWYKSWNTDTSEHHDELFPSLYKSINFIILNKNNSYIGLFFPSTFPYNFDIGKTKIDELVVNNFNYEHDLFVILGNNLKEVISNYSLIVGRPYFVRMKMLGNNQSRWSYDNEEQVREVAKKYRENNIPLDYIHLDIDYMDGFRDFTINKTSFPNMKKLTDDLKNDHIEIVSINDAAIKKDSKYFIYTKLKKNNLFVKYNNLDYVNTVWPGDCSFPNYLDDKCKKLFERYANKFIKETGVSGIWDDMNEPASFKGELPIDCEIKYNNRIVKHEEWHNVYGEHMNRSFVKCFEKENKRAYLFSRAGFATSSKYSFFWNGDNFSLWHHLRFGITQILSMSLSNAPFNGCDIGGFGGDTNKELLIRWVEAMFLIPFFRNHTTKNTMHQEAYSFDVETMNIYRKYMQIRYDFLPYLYNLTRNMHKNGELIVSPIFYIYPKDQVAKNIEDEYMVGDKIIIAPIVDCNTASRVLYLPQGKWINYFTNNVYVGNKKYILNLNLNEVGFFIKYNTLMPMYENLQYIDKENIDTLVLKLFGIKGECKIYDDDGVSLDYKKGKYNFYYASFKDGIFNFKIKKNKYKTGYKYLKLKINNKEFVLDFEEYNNFKINLE